MKLPKWLEQIFFYYPFLQMSWLLVALVRVMKSPSLVELGHLIFVGYFLSPLTWFIIRATFGQSRFSGSFKIGKKESTANAWLIYYQLQSIYSHFPFFERALRLIPGAYSFWLRLWGSKIGRKVNWTPECQIMDRGHLIIGDRAFLGNRSYLSAHAIKKSRSSYLLYVKPIKVGSDAMISFDCKVGPGVEIGDRAHVEACTKLYLNNKVIEGESYVHRK